MNKWPLFLLLATTIVSADELLEMQETSSNWYNWVMPAGNYNNQRYSKLDQISQENVEDLKVTWSFSTGISGGYEGNTLVIYGSMYVHTPYPNNVFALDLNNDGAIKWSYESKQDYDKTVSQICCDTVNRGLAYGDGKIFLNQADTTLVALDMVTGKEVWKHQRDDPKRGASSTGAPHVFKDKVLVGISGGDYGIRGYIKAYDLDGKEQWQVYNTGPDDEMGFDPQTTTSMLQPVGKDSSLKSWQGDQWQIGGGTTWGWFSYDPDLNVFYHGSGNPSNWNPTQRPGDNKWTSSLFARDLDTGKAKWAYQMTPHDEWGYDGTNEIILVDQKIAEKMTKTAVHFDTNGFAYTMDRTNGELLLANKLIPLNERSVNWSKGVDLKTGLHDRVRKYSTEANGVAENTEWICPSYIGMKGQQPAAYSPHTGLFYVPTNRICMDYAFSDVIYKQGQPYMTAELDLFPAPGGNHMGSIVAWNAREGKVAWSNPERFSASGGILVTSSDLVFYGTLEGYIKALNAQTGRELWRFKTASSIVGNVNAYKHDGQQYISVLSGLGGLVADINYKIDVTELDGFNDGLGSIGAYNSLFDWSRSGGVLTVFNLPSKALKQ